MSDNIARAILKAAGIDETLVTAVTFSQKVNDVARITVTRLVDDDDAAAFEKVTQRFVEDDA